MAKLIILALALTVLVAFAAAHRTITTTIIDAEQGSQQQCSQQVQQQQFNQCQRYLNKDQSSYNEFDNPKSEREGCCQELRNVDQQCQCEAVKQVLQQTLQQQQQQQGQQGVQSKQIKRFMKKAQQLPNKCNLQAKQCQIGTISITTTTISDDTNDNQSGSQQCQHIRRQSFNQCQRYIQQQTGSSYGPLLMVVNQQQPQGLQQQCCNELERVEEQCQCDALQQVYRHGQQQQQQQQQGGSSRGGQQQQDLQQVVQNLRNRCNIQAQQCRIPSAMF